MTEVTDAGLQALRARESIITPRLNKQPTMIVAGRKSGCACGKAGVSTKTQEASHEQTNQQS